MTLDALIMLLGTLVAVLPFLGFPNSWDTVILFVLGISILIIGIVVRRRSGKRTASSETPRVFAEHVPAEPMRHDEPTV